MPTLSHSTSELIAEVGALANRTAWLWSGRKLGAVVADKLERVSASGEWRAIPSIIALTLDDRAAIAEPAARAITTLRAHVHVRDVPRFDRLFRELSPFAHPEYRGWWDMQPGALDRVSELADAATVLSLAMCHPSGHVREAACRRSIPCADGSDIPFLLLRINDWVEPVRVAARAAVQTRASTPTSARHFADALVMLERMRQWGRVPDRDAVATIDALLVGPRGRAHLGAALSSNDRSVRRGAYRRLLTSPGDDRNDVLARALDDPDPAVRTWSGRLVCDGDPDLFVAWLDRLMTIRFGGVRAAAARRAATLGQPLPWRAWLFDDHAGVRAVAQQAAIDAGDDPAEAYRSALAAAHGRRLAAAVMGLGETGSERDGERLRHYLSSPAPRIRRSALHALAGLKAADIVELSLTALADDSPRVSHTARDLLLDRPGTVSAAELWAAFESACNAWGKNDALAVLSSLDHWVRLPCLLRAFGVEDGAVRARAAIYLQHWLRRQNRVFTRPSADVVRDATALIDTIDLSDPFRRELRAILSQRQPTS